MVGLRVSVVLVHRCLSGFLFVAAAFTPRLAASDHGARDCGRCSLIMPVILSLLMRHALMQFIIALQARFSCRRTSDCAGSRTA